MKQLIERILEGVSRSALLWKPQNPQKSFPMRRFKMKKLLVAVCVMGCVLMSTAMAKITYIDAELANTIIDGAAPEHLVNCTITDDRASDDGYWAFRTDRSDMTGEGIWVTDGGSYVGDYENTSPLQVDITLPLAGISYDLYAVIMNNNSGNGDWDVSARIGDTGDFSDFNKNSGAMTQALATDFEGDVTVSGGGDMTMKVLIGQYTPIVDDEIVSVYINGLDTWQDGNSHDQRTRLDGVGYEVSPPFAVNPIDGATGVGTPTVTLQWGGGVDPNALGHYVYLGTDPEAMDCLNPGSILPKATGEYTYSPIEENATYYWQVEVAMDSGSGNNGDPNNVWGPVWSFESVLSIPVINSGPSTQVVPVGGTAVFSLEIESVSTPTFAWYSSMDPNTNTPADDDFLTYDENLTISNATLADEGYYYCVVNNDSGIEVTSLSAALAVERVMAHWTFDDYDAVNNQYLDVSGEGHHADPNGTPTFIAGQVDDGISILCPSGGVPTTESWARAGAWSPSGLSGMLTVSFWINWNGPEGGYVTQNILCKGSENGFDWRVLTNGSGNLVFSSAKSNITASNGFLEIGTWVYCTVTFDGSTASFYKNGEFVSSSSFLLGGLDDGLICLGGKYFDTTPEGWMNGTLDEVRIYNYGLSDVEVAQQFIAEEPNGSVCVASLKPDSKYDFNDDCIINLTDFAEMAAVWLDCGLMPDCTQ